ncbi:MAG: hypothetical protein KY455_01855 [Euryarchaeota archaeon]|nr:hypothetical protein [Euryarchaeota archaeon]
MAQFTTVFLSILLLSFAFFTLALGTFAAYFGTGKSRVVGVMLMVVAVLAGFLFAMFTWEFIPGVEVLWEPQVVAQAVVAVLAATVGGLASLVLFLVSIMKA